jgi:hypothetical protein
MPPPDGELEALLACLAPTPEKRAALLEEHRQLEKDLLRLADPLPPPDFLERVMKQVARESEDRLSRREVIFSMTLAVAALALGIALTLVGDPSASGVGLMFAKAVVTGRELVLGLGIGWSAVWKTAALPAVTGLAMMMGLTLVALKRMTSHVGAKVLP